VGEQQRRRPRPDVRRRAVAVQPRLPRAGAALRAGVRPGGRLRPARVHRPSAEDIGHERAGTFQSCTLTNRLGYLLLSPELAATVTAGGVFRKGLWGPPKNVDPARLWEIYPEITAAKQAASDHAAVWVDLDV